MTASAERAPARAWVALAVVALPCIIYAMDLTILNLAIPRLSADLTPSAAQVLWIVDIYGFFAAGSLMIMGSLGDRIGRRRLLLIGSATFCCVSIIAAFARNAETLIAARAALGVAGATMAPSTLSLISNIFSNDRERTFAVSVWIASFSFGGAIGPLVGGTILAHFWWGAVFLAPVPVLAALLVVGPMFLPEQKASGAARLDILSAAMTLASVLPFIYGVKLAAGGGRAEIAALCIVVGLTFAVLFVQRQRMLVDPLLDMSLFKMPKVSAALIVYVIDFFVGFGILVLVAQYLQLVLGLSPFQAGLWTTPVGLGFVVGSLCTSPALRVMRPAHVLGFGLLVSGGGLALMAATVGSHDLVLFILGNVIFSVGSAPCTAIIADLVVSSAPHEQSGAASALSETASEFGGALGIALLGSLATVVYRYRAGGDMHHYPLENLPAFSGAVEVTLFAAACLLVVSAAVSVVVFAGSNS